MFIFLLSAHTAQTCDSLMCTLQRSSQAACLLALRTGDFLLTSHNTHSSLFTLFFGCDSLRFVCVCVCFCFLLLLRHLFRRYCVLRCSLCTHATAAALLLILIQFNSFPIDVISLIFQSINLCARHWLIKNTIWFGSPTSFSRSPSHGAWGNCGEKLNCFAWKIMKMNSNARWE